MAVAMAVRQGSDAWIEARRSLITATDIGVLLGLSPYKCEADLADEKLGGPGQDESVAMRIGTAMQPLIGSEYTRATGRRLRTYRGLLRHPSIEWAAASPDFGVVGERRLVEAKWTTSSTRFADGLPQDIEAQVQWQLGVAGYPVADVAVLARDTLLPPFEVAYDPDTFANLVTVAVDFRRRLAAGGPFERNNDRIRRDYPRDNGAEMLADDDVTAAVRTLVSLRDRRRALEDDEERIEASIKARMGEVATLRGDGFRVTWKRTKDSTTTDWRSLAASLLTLVPETDRDAVVGLHTTAREGFRPFRVTLDKE